MEAADLAAARSLAVLADVPAGSREQWQRDLRNPHRLLLAAHDDAGEGGAGERVAGERVVGVVTAAVAVDDADLLVLVVDPAARRRGIGRALVAALCDVLAALEVDRLLLEVRASNRPAMGLYRTAGFEEVARRRSYYRDGEDAVVLARHLGRSDGRAAAPSPTPRSGT